MAKILIKIKSNLPFKGLLESFIFEFQEILPMNQACLILFYKDSFFVKTKPNFKISK